MTDEDMKYFNEDNSHLKIDIVENKKMSDLDNFKIKIVKTYVGLYEKFPTLHLISCSYYTSQSGFAQKGWNARVSQVAWDTAENICQEEDYKKEKLIMYAYLSNKIKCIKKKSVIPMKDGENIVMINHDELLILIKSAFSYLNDMEIPLKNQLVSQQENKNHLLTINLSSRDWWGKKSDFKKDVCDFLGKEMMITMNYFKLAEELPEKTYIVSPKKYKI